jgi:ABC-type uncharacterized transport system permease subunit
MSGFMDIVFNVNNLAATIRMATPIALAAMGGAFSERSGVVNIGIEGMMLTGAFCGVLGSHLTGSPWLGVLCAVAGGGLVGALLAVFAIRLKADHVVTGVGINILASGATTWLMQVIWKRKGASDLVRGLRNLVSAWAARHPGARHYPWHSFAPGLHQLHIDCSWLGC